jgi:hypothetical protein
MEKAFKNMGYKTQVRSLGDFYDTYGLEGDDEDVTEDPEDDEQEEDSGEDSDMSEDGSGSEDEEE